MAPDYFSQEFQRQQSFQRAVQREIRKGRTVEKKCPSCGHVNIIDIEQVYADTNIICEKCGKVINRQTNQ